jgi:hypothetical protein
MKTLAKRIKRELENEITKIGHCAVYEDELERLWPIDEENRQQKIAHFANENGFDLIFYKKGLCAMFRRKSPGNSKRWNE